MVIGKKLEINLKWFEVGCLRWKFIEYRRIISITHEQLLMNMKCVKCIKSDLKFVVSDESYRILQNH
jgi:hypothetical protein